MNKKDLYIPVNVPDRNELIPGFGTMELIISGISLGAAALVVIIMCLLGVNILYGLLAGITIFAIAVILVRKDKYGENLIYKTQYVMQFNKSQKKYYYQYHNIYEGSVK